MWVPANLFRYQHDVYFNSFTADFDRGCSRVVARLRHLAAQGRQLHRPTTADFHPRYVAAVSFCVLLVTLSDSPNVCGIVGMCKSGSIQSPQLVFLIAQNGYAQASVVLSLGTNVLATSLVAYKAWCVFVILHAFLNPDSHLAINETGYTDNC